MNVSLYLSPSSPVLPCQARLHGCGPTTWHLDASNALKPQKILGGFTPPQENKSTEHNWLSSGVNKKGNMKQ